MQRNIIRILGFNKGSFPSKYLGVPLGKGTIKKYSWKDLIDRIRGRLSRWVLKPLNFPSHLVLVKSVLQAMPLHLFFVLAALSSILKKIKSLQRAFLWGGTVDKTKWALVSWETLCRPKLDGSLGLRDPIINNKIGNAKLWWRWITQSNEPWTLLWHKNYAPNH